MVVDATPLVFAPRVQSSGVDVEQYERQNFITPFLKYVASLTVWDVFKGTVAPLAGIFLVLGLTWWAFRLGNEETHNLERTADEDADEALESISGGGEEKKKKKAKKSGKGKDKKKDKEVDDEGEEEEK